VQQALGVKHIDLNCDLGELHPISGENHDRLIMPFISSCNVCCGFHSSNPVVIEQTIQLAIKFGIKIGAHPSYKDRDNFGRKSIDQEVSKTIAELRYQIGALKSITESMGSELVHVKAHGALYHDIHRNESLAEAYIELIKSFGSEIRIMGMAGSPLADMCKQESVEFINESFADRVYASATGLRSRSLSNSVIEDPVKIKQQVEQIINGCIVDHKGLKHVLKADSICLHSDTHGSVTLAETIHSYLKSRGVEIC